MYCLYNWHIFLLHTWENAYANAYINNTVDIVQASLAELADIDNFYVSILLMPLQGRTALI